MIITIDRNGDGDSQHPVITIDTQSCHYPYAVRNAIELALKLDGHTDQAINEIFGRMLADRTVKSES